MKRLLVVGGASLDLLHLKGGSVRSVGGAGMYTAMAAHRCGLQVSLFSPRPDPCPKPMKGLSEALFEWLGPVVAPEEMPHFEISYQNGKTEYLAAQFGAEEHLAESRLPETLSQYDHVHIVPLGSASRQLSFLRACRKRGARQLSAGTLLEIILQSPEVVRTLVKESDLFFMNDHEAKALFGRPGSLKAAPGKLLYITLGSRGAQVVQGGVSTPICGLSATEHDPTGAGDSFCGGVLASLLQKQHPVRAGQRAVALATEMIASPGPKALLSGAPPPDLPQDRRVRLNHQQIERVAEQIATLSEAEPFQFVAPELPPPGDPNVVDYLFATILQQFGFWSEKGGRYHLPLIAPISGIARKGAFYLFEAYRRKLEEEPDFCSPQRQARLTREELRALFRSDTGDDPMPALEEHLKLAHRYGEDMAALGLSPQTLLDRSLSSSRPLDSLISYLDRIGGYKEDPLRKKSTLLALVLNQRPEGFLTFAPDETLAPVIDYHLMRSCLRVGLIEVGAAPLRAKLINREVVSSDEEWSVRYAAYQAIDRVVTLSGKSVGAVDWFFFGARKRCPELSGPQCEACSIDPVCAHNKRLFQPVIRTTFY